jgi:SAM-dependent methyltransferase
MMNENQLVIRAERLSQLCSGKRVLDVGCCRHGDMSPASNGERFLHGQLAEWASVLVGIDNDLDAIAKINAAGYNVMYGDAMNLSGLGLEKFDVVFAGELIEHLSCPGTFLDEAKRCLNPGGRLIITVPNAYSFQRMKSLRKGIDDELWTHDQHTCWYSRATTKFLLRRHGFEVDELAYCDLFRSSSLRKRIAARIRIGWAMGPRFAESIFAVGHVKA